MSLTSIFTKQLTQTDIKTVRIYKMLRKIEKLMDEKIRPSLQAHGGNIEIIDVDNGKVFVALTGGCQGCSASKLTLKDGVEKTIKQHYPEIMEVVDLTDHSQGQNPYQ